jgi:threonine/homoserine/homoserine lactone efflux protein
MSFTADPLVFLGMVVAISVTGVMMPGPVTAAAIAKGYQRKWAGLDIALGHALVEFPTIALMALGFSAVLRDRWVNIGIGILGGAMLVFMGVSMMLSRGGVVQKLRTLQSRPDPEGHPDGKIGPPTARDVRDPFPYHPLVAGVITTASNPYYFLWWATLGAALTLNALEFGLAVLVVFAILHWSIDLGWDVFLSYTVHTSRRLWNDRVFVAVFAFCGGVMVLFGVWFGASAVLLLLS